MADDIGRILSLVFTAGRTLHDQSGKRGSDVGTMLRLHTLRYVHEAGTPLMKDVARFLAITPSSATSLINGLVNAKLLDRHYDKRDRRIVRLSVTTKGLSVLKRGLAAKKARMRIALARLNKEERQQLINILQKIILPQT